jgi:hypothetical protein
LGHEQAHDLKGTSQIGNAVVGVTICDETSKIDAVVVNSGTLPQKPLEGTLDPGKAGGGLHKALQLLPVDADNKSAPLASTRALPLFRQGKILNGENGGCLARPARANESKDCAVEWGGTLVR